MNRPPESDDEVLDTGMPRRAGRRLVVGGTAAAAVALGIVVALHSGGRRSTPTADPMRSTVTVEPTAAAAPAAVSPQPVFGTVTPTAPAPVGGALDTRLCPRHRTCTNPPTSTGVRNGIETAIRATYGSPSALRVRNVVLDAERRTGRARLFAREISARTRYGRLDIRAAAVGPRTQVPAPNLQASTGLVVQFYGYAVDGELAARGNPDPVLVSNRMETLLYDPRLLVGP